MRRSLPLVLLAGTALAEPLFVDNDQPCPVEVSVDGAAPVPLAPHEIRRLDLPPGAHKVSLSPGGAREVQVPPGQASVLNPGGKGVYKLVRVTYSVGAQYAPFGGQGPVDVERIEGKESFSRAADFPLDVALPRRLDIPGSTASRVKLAKVPGAVATPDHAFAVAAQDGGYYDGDTVTQAVGILRQAKDPRLLEACLRILSRPRADARVDWVTKSVSELWTESCPERLVAAAGALGDSEDASGHAFDIRRLLLEKLGPARTIGLVKEAPEGTLRTLVGGCGHSGAGGKADRATAEFLLFALQVRDPEIRSRAARGLVPYADSLTDEESSKVEGELGGDRKAEPLREDLKRASERRAVRLAVQEDTPESLARLLGMLDKVPDLVTVLAQLKKTDPGPALAEALGRAEGPAAEKLAVAMDWEPWRDRPEVQKAFVSALGHPLAKVREHAFKGLVFTHAPWAEGTEAAIRAAMDAHADLAGWRGSFDTALERRRKAEAGRAGASGDLPYILAHLSDPDLRHKAGTAFRTKGIPDETLKGLLEGFAKASEEDKAHLCEMCLGADKAPGLEPLALWAYASGRDEGAALGWFDRALHAGHPSAAFSLFQAWKGKGGPMPHCLLRGFGAKKEADAVRLVRLFADEAAKLPAKERQRRISDLQSGLHQHQRDEGIRTACWKALAEYGVRWLSDRDLEARRQALTLLGQAVNQAKGLVPAKDLRAAAGREKDAWLKGEMARLADQIDPPKPKK